MASAASEAGGLSRLKTLRNITAGRSLRARTVRAATLAGLLAVLTVVVPAAPGGGTTSAALADPTVVNLLDNGSFETGGASLSPWIFRHDVTAALTVGLGDAVDGAQVARIHVAATSPSTWLVQLRQERVRLHGANTYTLSFSAKASTGRVISASLQSSIAPNPTFVAEDFTLVTTWQKFSFTYTAPVDVADAFVGFNLAQATGDVEIDHVTLTNSNLLTNGGFETGRAKPPPWTFRNDIGAALSRDTSVRFDGAASARMTVPVVGARSWFAQLQIHIPPIFAGRTYRLSFDVISSRPRAANARLQGSYEPNPTAVEKDFTVTTAWTRVSFDLTPKLDIEVAFFGFNLAQDVGTVWLDDITLTLEPVATGTVVG